MAEVSLASGPRFDAGGTPDPFGGVELTARFRSPDGRTLDVRGFFDGDGEGGQAGHVWKLRVRVDEPGRWSWTTSSSEPSLDGLEGSLEVEPDTGDPAVRIDAGRPDRLYRSSGRPEFLVGDWLVTTRAGSGEVPLNHNAPSLTDADRRGLVAFHTARGLTLYSVYLQNAGDLGHRVDPFLGGARDRFDLAAWHRWEAEFRRIREAGLTLEFWLSSDLPFDLTGRQFEAFVEYAYARLGALPALWVLGLEADEYWSADRRAEVGRHFQAQNVFDRPVAMHFSPGRNPDRAESWMDYVPLQHAFGAPPRGVNGAIEANGDAGKPIYASEFAHGETPDGAARRALWAAFVSGASLVGNGPGRTTEAANDDLAHFTAYVNGSAAPGDRPAWWRMDPADGLVAAGEAYLLREAGERYLAYLPAGGSVALDLSGVSGELAAGWYDPRTGSVTADGGVSGGGVRSFTAPDGEDWLLDLGRRSPSRVR